MNIAEINWKANFRSRGVDPQKAYQEVEKIRDASGGQLSAEDVIERAKAKRNVLHPVFEWDDATAAKEHRLEQARALLRSFEIVYADSPKTARRAYEIVSKKRAGDTEARTFYSTTEEAMKDPQVRDALIADAIRQAMAWRRRFQGLRELQLLHEAIDQVVEEVGTA